MDEALKMPKKSQPYQFNAPKAKVAKETPKSQAEIAIDNLVSGLGKPVSNSQKEQASFMLKGFLKGEDFPLNYSTGYDSRLFGALVTGLLLIMNLDESNSLRAKEKINNALNPLKNPVLFKQIVDNYNKATDSVSTIKGNSKLLNIMMNKTFSYLFNQLLDNRWMTEHKSDLGAGFIGFFIRNLYFKFNYFYNEFLRNPEKYPQIQALVDPKLVGPKENKPEIDRSKHTISDIIKYIYSPGAGAKFDPKKADAFNNANKEILSLLKSSLKNRRSWKVFEYTVINKLDAEEILDIDDDFRTAANVTGAFTDLAVKNKKAAETIDSIYKKYKLDLPPFRTWSSADLVKGPSDRGQLSPDALNPKSQLSAAEIGRDEEGDLAKVRYNRHGEKQYSPLQELRMFIRKTINESINK